jgi:hypothetical protein
MIRKLLSVAAPAALVAVVVRQWPDISRYMKIKRLSTGTGHPQYVPAPGRINYPQQPEKGAADGTGEFDSASRGGPASS